MVLIDFEWFKTDNGRRILQSVTNNGRIKRFGILERPSLEISSNYEEIKYKILLIGKSNCGKTAFIESLFGRKSDSESMSTTSYCETPGIGISNVYWPVKLANLEKFIMFKLALWDMGNLRSRKFDYMLQSCFKNLDCIIYVFSWIDTQSFLEVIDSMRELEDENQSKITKIVIGTKFDMIAHSEIKQEMIDDFEKQFKTKIIRFSSINTNFDNISKVINKLSEALWTRDQVLVTTNKNLNVSSYSSEYV